MARRLIDAISVATASGSVVEMAATSAASRLLDAAELARLVLAREREHSGPRRALLLENDQRACGIEQQMEFFGNRRAHVPSTVSLPVRIAAARSRTSAG